MRADKFNIIFIAVAILVLLASLKIGQVFGVDDKTFLDMLGLFALAGAICGTLYYSDKLYNWWPTAVIFMLSPIWIAVQYYRANYVSYIGPELPWYSEWYVAAFVFVGLLVFQAYWLFRRARYY